ncbi:MAG: aconitate hydratase AcnA [Verrucomicrobiota bacterium]
MAKNIPSFIALSKNNSFYSLPELEKHLGISLKRLPISLRIVLESVLRNCDEKKIFQKDVEALARWNAQKPVQEEIPFVVSRIILQDFTGVPLLVDLAALRSAMHARGKDPKKIEPQVPVHLVVDHSVQVDVAGVLEALAVNMDYELKRNQERYQFLKWGQKAFRSFRVVPPGVGIIHQINLEHLAQVVTEQDGVVFPDTLVGTDSHTTMINGLGIVGWGVGGIEAEAGMLGQPISFLTPEVVGVYLKNSLQEGVTATDLALALTQRLRQEKVVGKFVEFYGPGAAQLSLPDRATIANMAPEYGATMGFFPVDEESLAYLRLTGRDEKHIALVKDYFTAQEMFGIPQGKNDIDYSRFLEFDLASVAPSVAGPKRPQDRIELTQLKNKFAEILKKTVSEGGYEIGVRPTRTRSECELARPLGESETMTPSRLTDGSIVLASITSCTNTSNPSVMLAAGLLAKKAVEKGLTISPHIKTSLAPGSRVVSEYLKPYQAYLDALGFQVVGYGCMTCIGNSGKLKPEIEEEIKKNNLITASVLSGNRNFEARIHPLIKANFLMSPPMVIAFAIAGKIDVDLTSEPLGMDAKNQPVYLRDIWPNQKEIQEAMSDSLKPELFKTIYQNLKNPAWEKISAPEGELYAWDARSTYIQEPPFFAPEYSQPPAEIHGARALAIFGDSITTDHISPAGAIQPQSPAGRFLMENGVKQEDFNSYGARRGNDRVMTRGTFANVRIRNLMLPNTEGGFTRMIHSHDSALTASEDASVIPVSIYEAAMAYQEENVPIIIIGGKEYGTGSSRDWAAKGTRLLGIRAVIAESFERIHRSNLAGMGVLPCCFEEGTSAQTLKLNGSEIFSIQGLESLTPRKKLSLEIMRKNDEKMTVPIILRLDTPVEIEYYQAGGILPFVLRRIEDAS